MPDTTETLSIRDASRDDARDLAELIEIAGGGIPTWLWSGMAGPGESPLDVGTRRARRDEGGFSWRHALVAEAGGRVTGMILAYRLPPRAPGDEEEAAQAGPVLRPFVELELEAPGSWYINAFAVREGLQGRGIGARLLDRSLEKAAAAGCGEASVQYFSQNLRAGAFYERHGFEKRAERVLAPGTACRYAGHTVLLVRRL
jgi:ribosomal protein S18 acetylase RimI-like enzyme